jgi:hypothetical protein
MRTTTLIPPFSRCLLASHLNNIACWSRHQVAGNCCFNKNLHNICFLLNHLVELRKLQLQNMRTESTRLKMILLSMILSPLIILCETAASVFKHRRETLLSVFGDGIDLRNDFSGKKHLFPYLSQWLETSTLALPSPHNRSREIKIVFHILPSIKLFLQVCSVCGIRHFCRI